MNVLIVWFRNIHSALVGCRASLVSVWVCSRVGYERPFSLWGNSQVSGRCGQAKHLEITLYVLQQKNTRAKKNWVFWIVLCVYLEVINEKWTKKSKWSKRESWKLYMSLHAPREPSFFICIKFNLYNSLQ